MRATQYLPSKKHNSQSVPIGPDRLSSLSGKLQTAPEIYSQKTTLQIIFQFNSIFENESTLPKFQLKSPAIFQVNKKVNKKVNINDQ